MFANYDDSVEDSVGDVGGGLNEGTIEFKRTCDLGEIKITVSDEVNITAVMEAFVGFLKAVTFCSSTILKGLEEAAEGIKEDYEILAKDLVDLDDELDEECLDLTLRPPYLREART
jgi:hypothetical protein